MDTYFLRQRLKPFNSTCPTIRHALSKLGNPAENGWTILGQSLVNHLGEDVLNKITWVNCELERNSRIRREDRLFPVAILERHQDSVFDLHRRFFENGFAQESKGLLLYSSLVENPNAFFAEFPENLSEVSNWVLTSEPFDSVKQKGIPELADQGGCLWVCPDDHNWILYDGFQRISILRTFPDAKFEPYVKWIFGESREKGLDIGYYVAVKYPAIGEFLYAALHEGFPVFRLGNLLKEADRFISPVFEKLVLDCVERKVVQSLTDLISIAENERWFGDEHVSLPHNFPDEESEKSKTIAYLKQKTVPVPRNVNEAFYEGLKGLVRGPQRYVASIYALLLIALHEKNVSEPGILDVECIHHKVPMEISADALMSLHKFLLNVILYRQKGQETRGSNLHSVIVNDSRFEMVFRSPFVRDLLPNVIKKLVNPSEKSHSSSGPLADFAKAVDWTLMAGNPFLNNEIILRQGLGGDWKIALWLDENKSHFAIYRQ